LKKIIIIIIFFSSLLFAQLSPGDLSSAHQHLEGIKNCTQCHLLGRGLSNQKCLDCHKEIKERIEVNRGYHSSNEVKNKSCWFCHSEHHGRNFKIINFNEKEFQHEKTGFKLTGKHSILDCRSCHNSKFAKTKNEKSFLGLKQDCQSCHTDVHQNSSGKVCSSCHNTESFNATINFDHSKTGFRLLDAHSNLKCIDCHKKHALTSTVKIIFSAIKDSKCTNCHTDVHNNKFGSNCLSCHNFESFNKINKKSFNHSKTRFALIGKHNEVNCNKCHSNRITDKLKFDKCVDCHQDYHKGQLTKYGDCKECHNEFGFSPSLFTIEKHNETKFTLTGSHLAVECSKCHYSDKKWIFRFSNIGCINCHRNVHGDEIQNKFMLEQNCLSCHNTQSWQSVNFNHDLTEFGLVGKHKNVECRSCHLKKINENFQWRFLSLSKDCSSCHNDNHNNQFGKSTCNNCHSENGWIPSNFDHNNAKFKLEGKHKEINCDKCHYKIKDELGRSFTLYKIGKIKCIDCHY
jgi:hypothetical protein